MISLGNVLVRSDREPATPVIFCPEEKEKLK